MKYSLSSVFLSHWFSFGGTDNLLLVHNVLRLGRTITIYKSANFILDILVAANIAHETKALCLKYINCITYN